MKRLWSVLFALALFASSADAATRRVFPGGMWGDALPGGELVLIEGDHVTTHQGPVAMPEELMFTRITAVGGFKIAAKSHASDITWLWENGTWRSLGRISHGVQGHIFADDGTLFVLEPCANCESQGVRYWQNGPVFGSPTYNPFTDFARQLGVTKIYEWTFFDGITVGQGEEGGAVIQYHGKHFLLEPGDTRFIQFHKSGDALSIAMTKFREREVVLWWLTTGEIESLPAYTFTPPVVVPPPAPVPAPKPEPVPMGPDRKEDVEKVRAKYPRDNPGFPHKLGDDHWRFLVELAQRVGGKLFRKDGGDRVFVPALGFSVSQDIIIVGTEWVDVLGDGENTARPNWEAHPDAGEPKKWIDVSGISVGDVPPVVVPPPDDVAALKERVRLAEADVVRQAELIGRLEQLVITERAAAQQEQTRLREESTNKGAEIADLKAQLANRPAAKCEVRGVPSWAGRLGIRASCVLVQ